MICRRIQNVLTTILALAVLTLVSQSIPGQSPQAATDAKPPVIDLAKAPAPVFDDPVWNGATDPFVIWNPVKRLWHMYYTQRRATLPEFKGVDWVHGTAIGIATSPDGLEWKYAGVCQGDHDLSEPLKAKGLGPEPGITWWAPCFVYEAGVFHMFVTRVEGVYTNWQGQRQILHFTSADGLTWKYVSACALASDRVIDASVYRIKDTWQMVYKNEAAQSRTFRAESRDLVEWTNSVQVTPDGSQEAPFVFRWKSAWWLIVDYVNNRGLRIYRSDNGIDGWKLNNTVLAAADGKRPKDNAVGHHPGIVVQELRPGEEQCVIYYFTHQGLRSVIQVAELELDAEGKVVCNRNKYVRSEPKIAPL
jgi:hypothetical protein